MANEEHLVILKQGVEVWNTWRKEHPDVRPDLRGADLIGANLSRADLSQTNLSHANLRGATLSRANFDGADLSRADLSRADLRGATLGAAFLNIVVGATLIGADLSGADLSSAYLVGVNLSGANLSGANLRYVGFFDTTFSNTNLSSTTGLGTCYHIGPSTIDHRTLAKSGDLPTKFLQGCGLPDWLIEAYKLTQEDLSTSQVTDIGYRMIEIRSDPAIQFHSCFISYSSKNDPFARRLHEDLQNNGVRCWFAPEDLKIGSRIRPAIHDAIRLHDKLLIILSEHSTSSHWVEDEVERALEKERRDNSTVLFPIRLDDSVMDIDRGWAVSIRNTRHIGDFCSWDNEEAYSQAFDRLLRDLRAS